MKIKKRIYVIVGAVLLVLGIAAAIFLFTRNTAPQTSNSTATDVSEEKPPLSKATLLIYMCGSSLETTGGSATANIREMLGARVDDEVNIVIQTGGARKWRGFDIPSDKLARYSVQGGVLVKVGETELANMGEAKTLADFVQWGTQSYPAEETSLILWNHGGGFVKGACFDELFSSDSLTVTEITAALTECRLEKKLEFICFDACKMACFDTAVSISPFADFMIASQDLEHAGGLDYRVIAENLGESDFYEKVLRGYAEKHENKGYYTLSCTDLSQIDKLREALHKTVSAMSEADGEAKIPEALQSADIIENSSNGFYDFGAIAEFFGVETGISEVVQTENSPSKQAASGLNLLFPADEKQLQSYLPICTDEVYKSFLESYFAKNSACEFSFEDRGFVDGERLSFTVKSGAEKYIRRMEYTLGAVDLENDAYYQMGTDNDFSQHGSTFSVNFTGRWVYFGGYALSCQIMTEKNNYTVYRSPVLINGSDAELIFTYNSSTRKAKLNGYVLTGDVTGRIMTLAENDEVTVLFKEMESETPAEYAKFTYSSECTLEIKTLPDGIYVFQAVITDIFGNEHYTNIAVSEITGGKSEIEEVFSLEDS